MRITARQKQAVAFGAAGVGALLMARAWRAREGYDFNGKSVLITGGSRGLGPVMARELAAEGARLTITARDEVGPIDHMKLADYEDAMNTHFWGPLYMILAALPFMRRSAGQNSAGQNGAGRIVNISSIGGKIAVPHLVPYSASKFALTGLSDGLRIELMRHGVIVTTVCPGLMRTGSPVNAMFKGRRPQEYAWFAISDSLPLASISAERAARQIICRRGDAELVITVQAKLAVLARAAAPELFQDAMAMVNRLLPGPASADGDVARPGRESESEWAPSALTAPIYEAARDNHEL